jgi:hypothetical protein
MRPLLRIAALLAWALAFCLSALADPLDAGPTTLTLAYHTNPGDRIALKEYMQVTGLKQLAGWKEQGILKDYRVYWSRYTDSLNWDMLQVLQFADTTKVAEWKKIEARFPGGLPVSVAKLCTAIHTNPADLHFAAGEPSPTSVFLIIPYDYLVSTPRVPQVREVVHHAAVRRLDRREGARELPGLPRPLSGVALLVGAHDPRVQGRGGARRA